MIYFFYYNTSSIYMDITLGKYTHYKGKTYEVIGTAVHSETLDELVLYKQLYEDDEFKKGTVWARPADMFFDEVVVDGVKCVRFVLEK